MLTSTNKIDSIGKMRTKAHTYPLVSVPDVARNDKQNKINSQKNQTNEK